MVYVPPGIALVLTVAEKFPAFPVNPVEVVLTPFMVMVAICPTGDTCVEPAAALSLPERLIVAVPWAIVCEAVRLLNAGVALLMVSVIVVAGPARMLL